MTPPKVKSSARQPMMRAHIPGVPPRPGEPGWPSRPSTPELRYPGRPGLVSVFAAGGPRSGPADPHMA